MNVLARIRQIVIVLHLIALHQCRHDLVVGLFAVGQIAQRAAGRDHLIGLPEFEPRTAQGVEEGLVWRCRAAGWTPPVLRAGAAGRLACIDFALG